MDKTLKWVLDSQLQDGSFPNTHPNGHPYPEMGYLIPTLFDHKQPVAALACAEYLLRIQHEDGSFDGFDGTPRTFDTAACSWALKRAYTMSTDWSFFGASAKAAKWVGRRLNENGSLCVHAHTIQSARYTSLAAAWTGQLEGTAFWQNVPIKEERSHYVAYSLEGEHIAGVDLRSTLVASLQAIGENGLFPYILEYGWAGDSNLPDLTGSLQMARLYRLHAMQEEAEAIIKAVEPHRTENGGIPILPNGTPAMWTARYWLEATYTL